MKLRRRNFKRSEETQNFWPSFTDMISTIALVLFFLMILAYVQNIITGSNLEYAKKQLIETEKKLEESNAEISNAEKNLRLLEDRLDEVKAEVEKGEIALKLSEEQVDEQRQIIAESNRELGELRSTLEGIAVFRVDVLNKVKSSVENELGQTNTEGEDLVSISDNGNIIINESLVFDYNSYTIKEEGKEILNKLADAFENVLNDKETRANIDAINIQGHADQTGGTEYNRELSSRRAISVVNYLLDYNNTLSNDYGRYFMASGYSNLRPITPGRTEEERAKNRRIEISLVLKDSNVQEVIDKYLEETEDIFE